MSTYPRKPRAAFLNWCRVHGDVFSEHAAEIGVSEAAAEAFNEAVAASETLLLEQKAAQEAARVATQKVKDAFAKLEKDASRIVRSVRAFAERSDDPDAVYATAEIPPIARRSPTPPPAQPTDLNVKLDATSGSLTLRWKATNPGSVGGTLYIIRRRLPGEPDFAFVGVVGKKSFTDTTLPAGLDGVQYTVQPQRGNAIGPASPILTIHFGKLEDPHRIAQVASGTAQAPQPTGQAFNVTGQPPHTRSRNSHVPKQGPHATAPGRWSIDIPPPRGEVLTG